MTEILRLPERIDGTTVDVDALVAQLEARTVVLDWRAVSEADPSCLRALLTPFLDRMEEFEDGLGVMSMPELIEAVVNHVVAGAPLPEPGPAAWLVLQSQESKYADEEGQHYEYPPRIPNGRRVSVGDTLICCLSKSDASDAGRIFGIGTVGEIVQVDDDRVRATYSEYQEVDPLVSFEQVGGDPRQNRSNSINRVPMSFAERVRARASRADRVPQPGSEGVLPAMDLTTGEGVRNALHELVALDLLGPACGPDEELLEDAPRTRYVVGTLAPRAAQADQLALDDRLDGAGERGVQEGATDSTVPASNTLFSSSIGFTFVVTAGVDTVRVEARWGEYERVPSEIHFTDHGDPRMVWRRRPHGGSFELRLQPGPVQETPDTSSEDVCVTGIIRPPGDDGSRIVTLFLVNGQQEPDALKDSAWVFQPELKATATDGESAVFGRRDQAADLDPTTGDTEAEERAILGMTHRKHAEFAVGHGVGVHAVPAGNPWVDDKGWERATEVKTAVLPWYDVPVTETPDNDELRDRFPGFEGFVLDMGDLAALEQKQLVAVLLRIPEAYTRWIEEQRSRIDTDAGLAPHREAAIRALSKAELARDRLAEGVKVVEKDQNAYEAFRFANRAMHDQRLRSVYALRRRRGEEIPFEEVEKHESTRWRVFQLAFLLLNIPTVTRLDHPKRTQAVGSFADLLWFPTGGGKTEAYLGVAAYSIAIRRLQGDIDGYAGDGGVTVIMRYTLRLLTLQQFQRATTLVCAMEQLRLEDPVRWGMEPFRIGLWVGGSSTPNTTFEANKWVNENKGAHEWDSGNRAASPLQLTNCPWCGSKLRPDNVSVELYKSGRGRTFVHCRGKDCAFSKRHNPDGLPVLTVDEEIYRLLPTFLLATVDKFAQMPWRGDVQALFGRVVGRCQRHGWLGTEPECKGVHPKRGSLPASSLLPAPKRGFRPPDLIIQDELHLISGPLGTLVGLYETAIDQLCSWEKGGVTVRPKVIASTATTRRAAEQVNNLFCRQVEVFPPSGLDADDNFFARQRSTETRAGRRYMGVCAPGRSRPSVLIRVYVAVIAAAQWLWDNAPEEQKHLVDPYMTLLGYFNSLRELGGMRRLVDDDVSTRTFMIERGDRPGLAQRRMYPDGTQELTSRIRSSRIPDLLDQLEVPFPPATEKGPDGKWPVRPLDVVLATNMVSVGVDVQRLGLMVVSGQPKATAEYIQASSRVGRSHPGLVVTVLNWARPRDLSHYEQFEHYHAVFYRYVEALSVTPFAPRALSRGLTGVLASLIRLDDLDFNPNPAAQAVTGAGQFAQLSDLVATRAQNVTFTDDERVAVGTRVRQELSAKLDAWGREALVPNRKLGYRKPRKKDDVTVPLLKSPGTGPWGPFTVPTSLREVEPGVGLVLGGSGRDVLPAWRFARPADGDDE